MSPDLEWKQAAIRALRNSKSGSLAVSTLVTTLPLGFPRHVSQATRRQILSGPDFVIQDGRVRLR